MTFIHEKIRLNCENLQRLMTLSDVSITDVQYIPCTYKTTNTPPPASANWQVYDGKEMYGPADRHFWFHFSLDVPAMQEHIEYRLSARTGREGTWDCVNPQCTLFIDSDSAYQAFDVNHTEATISSGHHDVYIYFYTGSIPCAPFLQLSLRAIDLRIEKLYYDLSVPYQAMMCLSPESNEYIKLLGVLDRATLLTDYRHGRDEAFYQGIAAADKYLADELYAKLPETPYEIGVIGHTHIDVAWLWTLAQTREKAQRSFSTALRLMEKYPEYIFQSSQPQLYAYVKESDPALYERIKERVREGRWEVEGAMWLEADTNISSGESLVRQLLYGKQFMREEFGVESCMLWLPDVFGYSGALPQILKKSGVPYFFTIKMNWNETNKLPHDHFIWQGIDGSEVFAVLGDAYVKKLEPSTMLSTWKHFKDKKNSHLQLSTFGFGDGGGGPTADMLEQLRRLKGGLPGFPKLTHEKSLTTIRRIQKQFYKNTAEVGFVPRWVGEMYLEMHRGVYTSQAKNKKNNRLSELLYESLEVASSSLALFEGFNTYPSKMLYDNWHTILKNQFHDIIPGSSIHEVYEVSDKEYASLLTEGKAAFDKALDQLAAHACQKGLFVYNPSPFAYSGLLQTEDGVISVSDIPANGWAVVSPTTAPKTVTVSERRMENECLSVCFNEAYQLVSVYDKQAERELIMPGMVGNALSIYEDYPRCYDAWEITEYYMQKKWSVDSVKSVEYIDCGTKGGVRVTYAYGDSVIIQTITLSAGSSRVDFATEVDWHEDHVLLKAEFPLALCAPHATYEIQFGHVERPIHRNTSWDQAKFEVCAHKWADLSESDYGVSLLNDCKYGYSLRDGVLALTLLKAATYPDPEADRGHHTFTYALYCHNAALGVDTIREAFHLNMPLHTRKAIGDGHLPATFAPVTSSDEGFVIRTVKRAEDTRGVIVRGYEALGRRSKLQLSFKTPISKVYYCDLMENVERELEVKDGTVCLTVSPFEIVTLRIE